MTMNATFISLTLDPEIDRRLRVCAALMDQSKSALIRQAIDLWLSENEPALHDEYTKLQEG